MRNQPIYISKFNSLLIALLLVLITPLLGHASGILYRVDKIDLSLLLTRMANQVKARRAS